MSNAILFSRFMSVRSRKLNLPFFSSSNIDFNLLCTELNSPTVSWISVMLLFYITRISSTYL
jgi:hypothetical protein